MKDVREKWAELHTQPLLPTKKNGQLELMTLFFFSDANWLPQPGWITLHTHTISYKVIHFWVSFSSPALYIHNENQNAANMCEIIDF